MRCHLVSITLTARDAQERKRLRTGLENVSLAAGRDPPVCIRDYAGGEQLIRKVALTDIAPSPMPIPARIIIGSDGAVRHVHVIRATDAQHEASSRRCGSGRSSRTRSTAALSRSRPGSHCAAVAGAASHRPIDAHDCTREQLKAEWESQLELPSAARYRPWRAPPFALGMNLSSKDVLAKHLSRPKDRSIRINNGGRAVRDSVRYAACNICSNDCHLVVPRPRDIDGPACGHDIGPLRRQAVVAWQENGHGAARNHVGRQLGVI